jgi:exonuclease VII large subunit
LKTNDLTIHEKDITEALKDNIKDTFTEEHRDLLQKINDHYSKLQTDSVAEIDRIVAVRKTELEELAKKLTEDITRHAELKKHEIKQYDEMKENKEFEDKLKGY